MNQFNPATVNIRQLLE